MKFKELRQRLDELTVKLGDPIGGYNPPKRQNALMMVGDEERAMDIMRQDTAGVETRLPDFGSGGRNVKRKLLQILPGNHIYAGIRALTDEARHCSKSNLVVHALGNYWTRDMICLITVKIKIV